MIWGGLMFIAATLGQPALIPVRRNSHGWVLSL